MPIYEFLCQECHEKSSILLRNISAPVSHRCPECGSNDLVRTMSSFAYHRSMQSIHEAAGEPRLSPGPDYYKDPRNIGRWSEKKFQELGIEMPSQMKEDIKSYREGELPKPMKEKMEQL